MSAFARNAIAGLLLAGLAATAPAAAAGPEPKHAAAHRALWEIRPFMTVKLVPREAGALANEHPGTLEPEALRQQLSGLMIASGHPLFDKDELALLAGPLSQALAVAGPGDDLLLVSTYRRDGSGFLVSPKAVTARLFLAGGCLNLIVHDERFEFYGQWSEHRDKDPRFEFGSRTQAGSAQLRSRVGTAIRPDWVALPMMAAVVAPVPAAALPARVPVRDEAFYEVQQQRLRGLQRMLDNHLISEEEYQHKRKEILAGL